MPDTSPGLSRLDVSRPSVKTTTARRIPSRLATLSAVRAMASCSDVAPNGVSDVSFCGNVRSPRLKGVTSSSRVDATYPEDYTGLPGT